VDLIERLRGDATFASLDAMVIQLGHDETQARAVLAELGVPDVLPVTSDTTS
jgi:hypothetical protein